MPDGEQGNEPMRRPRGRHAVPKPATAARDALPARLLERRLLVLAVSVATVASIGGAVTLAAIAGTPRPAGEATTVVDTQRPTPADPGDPSSFGPILPSAGPPPSASPSSPAPVLPPVDEPEAPETDAPVAPPVEPGGADVPPPAPTPGATHPPDPTGTDPPQQCEERDGVLGLPLFGRQCP